MSLHPSVLRAMVDAGATTEVILAAIEAQAVIDEKRLSDQREGNAQRQAKWRENHPKTKRVTPRNESNALRAVTPPNDIYSNPPVSPSLANAKDGPRAENRVLEAWNSAAEQSGLKPARALNPARQAACKRRIAEFGEETLVEAIGKLAKSPFHNGEGSRGWRADLGWLLRSAENVTKALELEPEPPPRSASGQPADFLDHYLAKKSGARR